MNHHSINSFWLFFVSVNLFLLTSCQRAPEEEVDTPEIVATKNGIDQDVVLSIEKSDEEILRAIALELEKNLEERSEELVPVIDYQELEGFLPKQIRDIPRTITERQTFSIKSAFSKIQGKYDNGNEVITVTLLDLAGFGKLAAYMLTDWLDVEIDRESDRGFERTYIFQDHANEHPTYERYLNEHGNESCDLHSWVHERFLVAIAGEGVPMSICESVRDEISFKYLERLAESHRRD